MATCGRYAAVAERVNGGVTVSLKRDGGRGVGLVGAELMRHFNRGDETAADAYADRLRRVAAILNEPFAAAALTAAADALDLAQAQVESPRDRERLLSALDAARAAVKSLS